MTDVINHEGKDTYRILLPGSVAAHVVEWWFQHEFECDLVMKRSKKTPGSTILITRCELFAKTIYTNYRNVAQVDIKKG